jgi:hypothetical protein
MDAAALHGSVARFPEHGDWIMQSQRNLDVAVAALVEKRDLVAYTRQF